MAELFETFDPSAVEPRSNFDPLPVGDYKMHVIESKWKDAKSGGKYVELTFQVIDGEYENRLYWDRLNMVNANETAVKIAKQTLAEITTAVGLIALNDTEQLHFKPMLVKISHKARKDDPTRVDANARYAALDGAAPLVSSAAKPSPAAAAKPAAAAAEAPKGKPWERKKAS